MSERIAIVGPGRMGLALGAALLRSGIADHTTYFGRAVEPPPHPLFEPDAFVDDAGEPAVEYRIWPSLLPGDTTVVLLAVPDAALRDVAYDLARIGPAPAGCAVLHLSGALTADVLAPLHGAGYEVGTMHPLQAVADPWLAADRLTDIAFAISGEPGAVGAARRLIDALGGAPLLIPPGMRPVYHAAAVVASNGIVAVLSMGVRLLGDLGISEEEAVAALLPLVRGTLDNLEHLGVRGALTGPVARGDLDTVRLHLARLSPADRALYSAVGIELLRLARTAGLDDARAASIAALLTDE